MPLLTLSVLLTVACGPEAVEKHADPVYGHEHAPIKVTFGAAFAPVTKVSVFDTNGTEVVKLFSDELTVELLPDTYYVDIRDDHSNSTFSDDGRLLFAPRIEGGEVIIAPYLLKGSSTPMLQLIVGEHHHDGEVGHSSHGLHTFGGDVSAMRARLVWEGARALVGPSAANSYTWPTGNVTGSYNYVAEDTGAWSSLRSAYSKDFGGGVVVVGWYVNCRHDNDMQNNVGYGSCSLTYGGDNASQYGYQSGSYHGGQCKPFTNLVAYRSGVYHGSSWAFKSLPNDANTAAPEDPLSTGTTVQAGDVLRRPNGHAVIVVRVLSTTSAVVLDSNWIGGDGYEQIATHVMYYSGSGNSNLGNYNTYNCIYTATTGDGC